MGRWWPVPAILLGVWWLGQGTAAAGLPAQPGAQAGGLGLLLAGVFGLLHLSSNYLQARIVNLVYLRTRNLARANGVYFALMRPGVLAHELAHAIGAALVGGRIVGFNILETSMVPGAGRGQVRLGHVTYTIPGQAGRLSVRLKDALVGLAPLPFGLLLIGGALALSGVDWLGNLGAAFPAAFGGWRFWLALLVILEVADHMTPSRTDRRNWPAALGVVLVVAILTWGALRLFSIAVPPAWWALVVQAAGVLVLVLAVPIAINLVLGALFWLPTRLLGR